MKERLGSSMPPHGRMPRGILRLTSMPRGGDHRWPDSRRITRQPSADDPYHAGLKDGVSGHTVIKPSRVNHRPWEYIRAEAVPGAIPGKEVSVIAQLRGVTVTGEFIPQPAERPEDPLVLTAEARIGLTQRGFIAVSADSKTLGMRVGNAAGTLQRVSVQMPPYDPCNLVVEYNNSLIIASA